MVLSSDAESFAKFARQNLQIVLLKRCAGEFWAAFSGRVDSWWYGYWWFDSVIVTQSEREKFVA